MDEVSYLKGKEIGYEVAAERIDQMANNMPEILLACGEMTAQERRTVLAVLGLAANRIRDLIKG